MLRVVCQQCCVRLHGVLKAGSAWRLTLFPGTSFLHIIWAKDWGVGENYLLLFFDHSEHFVYWTSMYQLQGDRLQIIVGYEII